MDFSTFPVGSTNIFPAANDTRNGQLLTEYNLRSRESVATESSVSYMIGPSYVHGEDDFLVRVQSDATGSVISNQVLEILPGRAVIDGYYIECLTPMLVDIAQANMEARQNSREPLSGSLSVGLRIMYSTVATMAGSILVNNSDDKYEGIKVVILPTSQFKLPKDCPDNQEEVTAHIKLADFSYRNSAIRDIVNNYPEKCQCIDALRVGNADALVSDEYVTKTGLQPNELYVFSGKSSDGETVSGKDTWCIATDSLIVWDRDPTPTATEPTETQAVFGTTPSGQVQLALPHKQIDGMVEKNEDGESTYKAYYATRYIPLPVADFNMNTSGTVNSTYTQHIKDIQEELHNIYRMPAGKQVGYIGQLDDRNDLPALNSNWSVGDYIIVGIDNTLDVSIDGVRAPSTMYVVLPGQVTSVKYLSNTTNDDKVPESLTGVELGYRYSNAQNGEDAPNTTDSATFNAYWGLENSTYLGTVDKDYFKYVYENGETVTRYYYPVATSGSNRYSDPVYVTGQIPLAQEDTIGGFFNVPEDALDAGYVFRDESGFLRLLDYSLLRSGTLAYQLGEDFTVPSGLTGEEVQNNLDEYVNNRVAFITSSQPSTSPTIINVYLNLSAAEEEETINIYNIDSRFNTAVYLHITGEANSNTTINISNCEKIRIDNNIKGTPVINIYRSNLYYDANVLSYVTQIQDLKLWYYRFDTQDANLVVDNMTVTEIDAPIISQDIDYWDDTVSNDNHFMYALRSVTFAGDGSIVGCEIYVKNNTTGNEEQGSFVITSQFEIPQGSGLTYPTNRMTRQLKITGSFVSAYVNDSPSGYMVINTSFTALSQAYNEYEASSLKGSISFFETIQVVTATSGTPTSEAVDGWRPNSFHIFSGGVIG